MLLMHLVAVSWLRRSTHTLRVRLEGVLSADIPISAFITKSRMETTEDISPRWELLMRPKITDTKNSILTRSVVINFPDLSIFTQSLKTIARFWRGWSWNEL